jgi:[ribosomal protein S5]-alanine N-acetyltransferase
MAAVTVPELTTQRLRLRAPELSDAPQVLVFRGDPEVQRFNDEPLQTVDEAATFIEFLREEIAADQRRHWAIVFEGTVVGLIGLHAWQHHHRRAELGYDLARSHWGRGIAGDAARAVIEYGFGAMALHRIQAHTIADNHRSVRLLEGLGFQREGTLREFSLEDDGAYHDSAVYGLLSRAATAPPG